MIIYIIIVRNGEDLSNCYEPAFYNVSVVSECLQYRNVVQGDNPALFENSTTDSLTSMSPYGYRIRVRAFMSLSQKI